MICFTLICSDEHEFEGWFPDNARFEKQAANRLLSCPICGNSDIRKAIMAPAVHSGRRSSSAAAAEPSGSDQADSATASVAAVPSSPQAASASPPAPAIGPDQRKMMMAYAMMRQVQTYVEKNFDNVGRKFPEEARKIHHGEVDARGIYGEVTAEEAKELHEEGIEMRPMPMLPKLDG